MLKSTHTSYLSGAMKKPRQTYPATQFVFSRCCPIFFQKTLLFPKGHLWSTAPHGLAALLASYNLHPRIAPVLLQAKYL